MGKLIIVRHGESRWNLCNRFSGWVDVSLSVNGVMEAQVCARHCRKFDFDSAFASDLERSQETLLIVLSLQGRTAIVQHREDSRYTRWVRLSNSCTTGDIPMYRSPLLNERYYGALQGMEKDKAEKKYGVDAVFRWRRGYDDRPPAGETLAETFERMRPYAQKTIFPRVRRGETVLLGGHGNTLRAIIMHFENISKEDVPFINLPYAHPLVYTYRRGKFVRTEGEYRLDRPLR